MVNIPTFPKTEDGGVRAGLKTFHRMGWCPTTGNAYRHEPIRSTYKALLDADGVKHPVLKLGASGSNLECFLFLGP